MTQPRMIGDRYELGELIGYGGMAEVHRGRDTRLNRDVAIKVLRADLARDPAFLTRFRREAHSAAGLNHPAIVSVYDTGESVGPDGTTQPFIVMEFVAGRTLRDIVKSEGSLPARRAMEITADICGALDFSHRNGIVHRDIKPANVMITPQGAVKVMDFGIARAVADGSATQTQTANVIGTAQYLSPEQARGEPVDARSDVYSTGCLLYELVTGVPPFQGDSPVAVAYQHVRENPVMPSARKPDLPRVLDSIVMKALAKNQLNRYQSAADMRSDLQRALANQPVNAESVMTDAERTQFIARPAPPPVAVPRREEYPDDPEENHRRTGLIWAAVVLALVLVIGIATAVILLGGGGGDNKVAVPSNLQGMTSAAAQQAVEKVGLKYKVGPTTSGACTDTSMKGVDDRVCVINPAPGQSINKNDTVTVQLYSTPKPQSIQIKADVTGLSYDDAVAKLEQVGIGRERITEKKVKKLDSSNKAVKDEVLSQSPQAYTLLAPGAKLTLEVATGTLVLPKVIGEDENQARGDINTAGFLDVVTGDPQITDRPSLDGKVYSVDPTANGKLAYQQSQKITLTLYKYQAPPTSCSPPSSGTSSGPVPPTGSAAPPTAGSSPTC